MFSKIIDISLKIREGMPVYPGNPEVSISKVQDICCGDSSSVSKIILGSHTGTHIDAPSHSLKDGKDLSVFPLESFVGNCRVLDATLEEKEVSLEFLKSKDIKKGERILLKTKNSEDPFLEFKDSYIFLSGDGADFLAETEVSLLGIDYLSIKQRGGSDNRPHTVLLSKKIPILEGLRLSEAEEGEYFLSALPLSLDIDGAPARAVLLK